MVGQVVMVGAGCGLLVGGCWWLWRAFEAAVAADACLDRLDGPRFRVLDERAQRQAPRSATSIVLGVLALVAAAARAA